MTTILRWSNLLRFLEQKRGELAISYSHDFNQAWKDGTKQNWKENLFEESHVAKMSRSWSTNADDIAVSRIIF